MKPTRIRKGSRVTLVKSGFLASEKFIGLSGTVIEGPDSQDDIYVKFYHTGVCQWIECENVEPEKSVPMKAEDIHIGDFVLLARKGGRYMRDEDIGTIFRVTVEVGPTGSCMAFNPDVHDAHEFYLTPDMLDPVNDPQITNCLLNEKKWQKK